MDDLVSFSAAFWQNKLQQYVPIQTNDDIDKVVEKSVHFWSTRAGDLLKSNSLSVNLSENLSISDK
ncbi:hypothetical protein pb186bvf_020064 [Paramecium bursaria]